MKHAAEVIAKNRQIIFEIWEKEVTAHITAADLENSIVLRDHLPNLLDDILTALRSSNGIPTQDAQRTVAENPRRYLPDELLDHSADHGRHRAMSKHYTVDQIIREYIVFHRVIVQVLRQHQVHKPPVADVLTYTLELAMMKSASSFSTALQEAQEVMVGALAHDLRNPLAAAFSLLELMRHEKGAEHFETLRDMAGRSIQKALRMTDELLDAATIRAGEGVMLNFEEGDLLQEVRTVHQEALEIYSRDLRLECDADEVRGVLDSTAIRRLLENLLINAIKYGDAQRPITIRLEDLGERISLSVHNLGDPISTERQRSLYNFLSSETDPADHPWGMGMALIKIVVDSHGGAINLISDDERGTRFTLLLNKHNAPGKRRTYTLKRIWSPR
ncbi:MAG: sensor histidine kinase [Catalinimonas sp.]